MVKAKIPRRAPRYFIKEKVAIPREVLENLYLEKKLTANEIAAHFGISNHVTILYKLMKFGIPRRTKSEVSTKYPKTSFSGCLCEKAYLFGLRAGDLWAKRHRNLIQVETSSPKRAQIELMRNAFGKYTTIHVCPKNGISGPTNKIYCLLDNSFEFLLEKLNFLPEWMLQDEETFFNFLAGYMDCEGSLSVIKEGGDVLSFNFSISSEDEFILRQLTDKLWQLGIRAHLYLSRMKGDKTNLGEYKKDFHRMVVYRKRDMAELITKLLPLSRHPEKIERMRFLIALIKNVGRPEGQDQN